MKTSPFNNMIRKTVNTEDDVLAYYDREYLIFKKMGKVTGTISMQLDLIRIGIQGLNSEYSSLDVFRNEDALEIVDTIIAELENVKNTIKRLK